MDLFEELVQALPARRRSLQANRGQWKLPLNDCWFGVPHSEFFGWSVLERVPEGATGFHFLLGDTAVSLIAAFCRSKWVRTVKHLYIGSSSYYEGEGLDYRKTIEAVSSTLFPSLESLGVGTWDLFCNSHKMLGKVGEISALLQNCPNLRALSIGGHFELRSILHHSTIEEIDVQIDDYVTCVNGGEISNETLCNLLSGEFPMLQGLNIDLTIDEPRIKYELPEFFLSASGIPQIKRVELSGNFSINTEALVAQSMIAKKAKVIFEQVDED